MVSKKKIAKLAGLNTGIVATNVVLFSKGLLGFSVLSGNIPIAAASAAVIALSVAAFGYGNYKILSSPESIQVYDREKLADKHDYHTALDEQKWKRMFEEDIELAKSQLDRLEQKKSTLTMLLQQKFSPTEMSYAKFSQVISDTAELIYANVQSVINRLIIFDYNEYEDIRKGKLKGLSAAALASKQNIFSEHIKYIKNIVQANENIIIKLDNLLLEVTKLDETLGEDVESLDAIKDINALISQTKLYKE